MFNCVILENILGVGPHQIFQSLSKYLVWHYISLSQWEKSLHEQKAHKTSTKEKEVSLILRFQWMLTRGKDSDVPVPLDIFDEKFTNWVQMVNLGRNSAKNPNFYGGNLKFWYSHDGKPPRHLVCIVFSGRTWNQNGQKGQCLVKNARFQQILAGATTFPLGPPSKNFPFLRHRSFSGARPGFWPFQASPHYYITILRTLDFGLWSMKLGKTIRAIKKWHIKTQSIVWRKRWK